MRKIYVVGGDSHYINWMQGREVANMSNADLVVFTGGPDIDPALYHRKRHPRTMSWGEWRDRFEVKEFGRALKLKKKMLGICRGAQLLCAMAGGILVQDSAHPSTHKMKLNTGAEIWVTSSHHQRMYPFDGSKPKHELIGWCEKLSPYNEGESYSDKLPGPEVEMASFPDIQALGIQSHPEWAYPAKKTWEQNYIKVCQELLNKHMVA